MTAYIAQEHLTEVSPASFYAEASEIGLPPGVFPDTIMTEVGNHQHLNRIRDLLDYDGQFLGMVYTQAFGNLKVVVLND